ncbi:hypothetical protein [Nocardioides sp. Leaf374]|uniref:hypothetical protein n=1 Tax=Nocardioides sp. Leaf374 TaxID=2876560 RepID=UPI001E5817E2|nr:hypothetical protein [Nocardioides sp. Leaf374]
MPTDPTPTGQQPADPAGPPPLPGGRTAGPPPLPEPPATSPPGAAGVVDPVGPVDASDPVAPGAATLSATCGSCGAQVAHAPGTTSLRCGSCGAQTAIAATGATIREHSYDAWRARNGDTTVASIGAHVLQCGGCGARTETVDLAGRCQFCSGALVVVDHPEGLVAPEAVIPFHVDESGAQRAFGEWVGSRRFAPGALKEVGSTHGLQGTYVPHWTFDAQTVTDYTGQRGEHYYVTRTRTVSDGKGGTRTETYQERRTRWHPASGRVSRGFDDVLVVASERLEPGKLAKMGPWTLADARPFQQEYLTGYSALRYDVDPQEGAKEARGQMREVIEDDCRRDIGGDEQRVSDMDVTYAQATFKLLLVPLWLASYLYRGTTYQVMVNATTGEVVGDRPWSVPKILAAVLVALLLVGAVVAALVLTGDSSTAPTPAPGTRP